MDDELLRYSFITALTWSTVVDVHDSTQLTPFHLAMSRQFQIQWIAACHADNVIQVLLDGVHHMRAVSKLDEVDRHDDDDWMQREAHSHRNHLSCLTVTSLLAVALPSLHGFPHGSAFIHTFPFDETGPHAFSDYYHHCGGIPWWCIFPMHLIVTSCLAVPCPARQAEGPYAPSHSRGK